MRRIWICLASALMTLPAVAQVNQNTTNDYLKTCLTMYNNGNTSPEMLAVCDKAIAANPTNGNVYFVKVSALFGNGKLINNKWVVPPGTVEALNKYLSLFPDGGHAGEVKQMLDALK
jgi:hypothetical protein